MSTRVARDRTAMARRALSRPVSLALDDALITSASSVFDYGCGRGDDVRRLQALDVAAAGWDPSFAPEQERRPADVVNLGYVVNVIEAPIERQETLRSAWRLARRVLVVAARLEWEARVITGRLHADGIVTSKGTFQKLFRQDELREWIDATLNVRSVAAAPGIYYVFREDEDAQRYLAGRVRSRIAAVQPRVSEQLYESFRPLFDELSAFVSARGRLPRDEELACSSELRSELGSIQRAFAVLRRVVEADQWQRVTQERSRDVLVYLALANFGGRPSFSQLPPELQYDVRDFFGSYKAATEEADRLLYSAGSTAAVEISIRAATVGKLTQEALYVHVSALPLLPPVLRVYEGCGRALAGTVGGANILKLHRQKPQVSYLEYPAFERDPHPALATVVVARLGKLDLSFRDFRDSPNPPVLHRKETFVAPDHPGKAKFERLTAQEQRAGLLDTSTAIGTRGGWEAVLEVAGYETAGHRLVRTSSRNAASST
jgi:DNA phosphorothioation-associated putative methyltransferase